MARNSRRELPFACPWLAAIQIVVAGITLHGGALLAADETSWALPEIGPGTLSFDARLRYEHNHADSDSGEIDAFGLRTRIGYSWDWDSNVSSQIELEDLRFIESDNRPPLDVPTTEVNQAWFDFGGLKLGRQVYTLDDHRFIGHVGWRQNIQSFDALTGGMEIDRRTKLNLGYLNSVRRVNASHQELDGIVLNGKRTIYDWLDVTAFAYLLDFEETLLASSDTWGLRATGKTETDALALNYALSYARQSDNASSLAPFQLDYLAGEISATAKESTFEIGFEILEGDGQSGFSTPLATVHKFNGFADSFAGASLGLGGGLSQGLKDYYARFSCNIPHVEVPLTIAYHQFETQNLSDYLGRELDIVVTYRLSAHAQILSKYARFDSDGRENVTYGGFNKSVFTIELNLSY